MALPAQTQVLVVGAGPNGLTCAITLARLGVQVTIVEALPTTSGGARAALVHARTLEVLHTIGVAKPLTEMGIHSKGVTFHGGSNKLLEVDVTQLRDQTEFPMVLLLSQHEIERLLEKRLAGEGVKVFRNRSVVGMKEPCSGGGLEVTFDDGAVISAPYVVGADGARSTIRRLAGIDFEDPHTGAPYDADVVPTSTLQILLADIYFEEPLPSSIPRDAVSWHLNKRLLLCPLPLPSASDSAPDKKRVSFWRIGIVIPIGSPLPPRHPDHAYLQKEIDARKPWTQKVTIASVAQAATYRVRSAVAKTFFKKIGEGNVLLVGDAAHVHSPSGGQGMNLGLCDAVALGHAIHSHIGGTSKGDAQPESDPDAVLRNYSTSRQKTAVKVIGMVKGMTAAINIPPGWRRIMRNSIMWIAGSFPFVRKLMAWRLSGLMHRDA